MFKEIAFNNETNIQDNHRRVVFMGTPDIACRVLEDLVKYEDIVGVFTQPDSIAKRGKKFLPSPVKLKAQDLQLEVFCPDDIREEQSVKQLKALRPDAIIAVAYGQILSREILDIPQLGCFNIHVSLLPKWRGAAPIERAILAGDEKIGLCLMKMEEGLDTGAYCYRKEIPTDGKSYDDIVDAMVDNIGEQLHTVLDLLDYTPENVEWVEQDETLATYAEKIGKRELYISFNDDAMTIVRKVLASNSSRNSKIEICGKNVTLGKVQLVENIDSPSKSGDIIYQNKRLYLIAADNHPVEVLKLKPDGKNMMDAKAFCAGIQDLQKSGLGHWREIQ